MFKVNCVIWINGSKGIKLEKGGVYDNLKAGIEGYKKNITSIAANVATTDKGYGVVQLFDEYDKKVFEFSCHGSNYLTPFTPIDF